MLRVSFQGFRNARYFPSGESCGAAISGLPKISSRSMMGGNPLAVGVFLSLSVAPMVAASSTKHKRLLNNLFMAGKSFLSEESLTVVQVGTENCERLQPLLSSNMPP